MWRNSYNASQSGLSRYRYVLSGTGTSIFRLRDRTSVFEGKSELLSIKDQIPKEVRSTDLRRYRHALFQLCLDVMHSSRLLSRPVPQLSHNSSSHRLQSLTSRAHAHSPTPTSSHLLGTVRYPVYVHHLSSTATPCASTVAAESSTGPSEGYSLARLGSPQALPAMGAVTIDGTSIAKQIRERLRSRVELMRAADSSFRPSLSIIQGLCAAQNHDQKAAQTDASYNSRQQRRFKYVEWSLGGEAQLTNVCRRLHTHEAKSCK